MKQHTPRYNSIYEQLKYDIICQKYKTNDVLPSIQELGVNFHAGRNTIRSAIALLEKNGFVTCRKGIQAYVIYDPNLFEYNLSYRKLLVSKKKAVHEVFETLSFLMPTIVEEILHDKDEKRVEGIVHELLQLQDFHPHTQYEMTEAFVNFDKYVLSFCGNPILLDLFDHMMRFVSLPIAASDMKKEDTNHQLELVKKAFLQNFSLTILRQPLIIKKSLPLFCNIVDRACQKLMKDHSAGIPEQEPCKFIWHISRPYEYLYAQICMDILALINQHRYVYGESLPSILELSNIYHVSKRTIIKALRILNEYRIIETKNGKGSIVIFDGLQTYDLPQKKERIMQFIREYQYALQLCIWMISALQKKHFLNVDDSEYDACYSVIQERFAIEPLMDVLCKQGNEIEYSIYKELQRSFVWNIFIKMIFYDELRELYSNKRQKELLEAIDKRNYKKVKQCMLVLLRGLYDLLSICNTNTLMKESVI